MDIQTKITFVIKKVWRTGKEVTSKGKPLENEIIILNNKIIKLDKIEFDEYKQVFVKLESNASNAYLEIDSSDDAEKRKIIKNSENEQINPGGSSHSMLVPGIYGFKVNINGEIKEMNYKINPSSNLEWKGLMNLRTYVESMAKGLSHDFYKEKMGLTSAENYEDDNMFDRYSNLIKDIDTILININNIIKNPLEDLKKQYKEKRYSTKPDSKSQKWLYTKGAYKNLSFTNHNFFYEKDVLITTNIIENIWFKKIIKSINQEILEIQKMFYNQVSIIEKNEKEKRVELNSKEEDARKMKGNVLQSQKSEIKYKIYNLKRNIESICEKKQKLQDYYSNLDEYKSKLSYIINNSWLKEINDRRCLKKPTLKMLKDIRYNYLLNIYMKLNINENEGLKNISLQYSNKLTSTLFEYYVLIHIMKIINIKGFQWPEELINQNFNYISDMQDLYKDIVVTFKGENYDIKIAYDKEIGNNGEGFIIGNSNHTRPDIRIDLYEKNGEIIKSIIFEVKCRSGDCVYDNNNKVEEQLKHYRYGFRYGKNEKDVMKKVIMVCLVTDKFRKVFEIKNKIIIGLPFEITDEKQTPRGYQSLENEIETFINSN